MTVPLSDAAVLDALRSIRDPDLNRDIVNLKFVKDLKIDGGVVSFTIELATHGAPFREQMREQARTAVAAIPGVTNVAVEMTAKVRSTTAADPAGKAAVPGVRNIIAVGAGKGGVGKTTVAVNLAIALSQMGSRVAMIDGDVYGPNVPLMLGIRTQLTGDDSGKIIPAEQYGIQLVSMAFMTGDDAPVIWRGPMLHSVIQQFFREVRWDNIDYLIVDMPPGTGDIALSLSQTVPVSGSVVITTPQIVSVADTRRAVRMYQKLNITPLGLVENMSHFVCPDCRHESDIFGKGGGEALATEMSIPFLGRIPIYEPIRIGGDTGVPITIGERGSPAAEAFHAAARQLAVQLSIASYRKTAIPLMPVR
ncbi:MAG: ATP-binding protein involved in chromosome partitioning [Acidobacteriota bacterium]